MGNEVATRDEMASVVEQVVVGGDLAKLSAKDRLSYYQAVCESVGLNPLTRPFSYLTLSGRLVLYANRDATDQLRKINGVSIERLERETVEGLYIVTAYAKDAQGRVDSSIGAVPIENLRGEAKANSVMKCECVPLDSEILTRRGFVRHDAAVIGEEVLAYDLAIDECVWTPLLNVTVHDGLPMVRLQTPSRFAVRCTPDHSWAVSKAPYRPLGSGKRPLRGAYSNRAPDRFLLKASDIYTACRIIMAAPERKTTLGVLSPTEAAVLGWAVTDGTIQRRGRFVRVGICQSKPEYFSAIRSLVNTLAPGVKEIVTHTPQRTFPGSGKTYATLPQHWWYLPSAVGRDLLTRAGFGTRADLPAIVTLLPGDARRAMLTAFMQAEGDKRQRFANGDAHILEAFQILAALEGFSTGQVHPKPPIFTQRLKKTRQIAGSNLDLVPIDPAPAWCPTTAYGTWVMRQDGWVTITGNTKAKRRVTLSICGLGMLDETEVGSIPDAKNARIDYDTGEIIEPPKGPATYPEFTPAAPPIPPQTSKLKLGLAQPELAEQEHSDREQQRPEEDTQLSEQMERSILLTQCKAAADKAKLSAGQRADILIKYEIRDPREASLAALHDMLEHLRTLAPAK